MSPLALRLAFWASVVGFAASLAVHVATFTGVPLSDWTLVLHLGLFPPFGVVIFGMRPWLEPEGLDPWDLRERQRLMGAFLRGIPGREKALVLALIVYAGINVTVGIERSVGGASGADARLFSGHWLFFYGVSAVLARHLLRLGRPTVGPVGEGTGEIAPAPPRGHN